MTNILLVEDNNELRKLLKIHLARAGYQVFEATNGLQALEVIEHNRIHLIVADIMMPMMDGYELTTELRSAGFTLPILMLTAKDTLADKRRGFHSGADDYMTKPVDMEEMLLRIEALLPPRSQVTIAARATLLPKCIDISGTEQVQNLLPA